MDDWYIDIHHSCCDKACKIYILFNAQILWHNCILLFVQKLNIPKKFEVQRMGICYADAGSCGGGGGLSNYQMLCSVKTF